MISMDILVSKWRFRLMRPVAIAGVSGGFASLVLNLVKEAVIEGCVPEVPFSCPLCPELLRDPEALDSRSFLLGLLVGISVIPFVELLFVLRQIWVEKLRKWLRGPGHKAAYRVLE